MGPGIRAASSVRRSSTPSPSQLSPSETVAPSQPQDLPSQNPNALGNAASLAQSNNAGPPPSKRVRGKTIGKGVDKLIAQHGGEKLYVPVLQQWKSLCGINASKASSLLGVYIRRMAPVKDTPTWWEVDDATQSVIIQAVLDKMRISDDYHGNPFAQKAVHTKCYRIHLNWRYKMKCHYKDILEQGLDAYNHPYDVLSLEDWRHMIDDVWETDKHKNRSDAGKKNRGAKGQHGHCSGSRSFVAEMTIPEKDGGSENKDFPELYEKTHTNRDKEWVSDICAVKHADMLRVREESSQSGVQLTLEEMSRGVLGKRKRYILGLGVGPQPSSSSLASNSAPRAHDEELLKFKAEMEKMQLEREEEKRAYVAEMEKMQIEREEERREREEERRERENDKSEREKEKREREAERGRSVRPNR